MKTRVFNWSRSAASLVLLAGLAAAPLAMASEIGDVHAKFTRTESAFLKSHPATSFLRTDDRITTVYGRAFQSGANPADTAARFLKANAGLFGVAAEDLVPGSLAADGQGSRGLMFDREKGTYKFTLVSFLQHHQGIPVFQSDVRLLVRNEDGHPLVLARSALRPIGDLQVDDAVAAEPQVARAFEKAIEKFPGIGSFSAPRVVIFAGDADHAAPAALAVEFEGSIGVAGDPVYEKWHIVADAVTGSILWHEDLIAHVDVTGNVKGMVTPGYKADICATESLQNFPWARVSIGSTVAYADANGNFTIPNSGSSQVTVTSGVRGRWFRVYNNGAEPDSVTVNVTPPGPANLVHNPSNNNATKLSAANAYIGANRVRDYLLGFDPAYPTIAGQTEFRVNINVSGTCNAFYDGSSINFYPAGGGCPSTAYGSVVYHEYGHHMVNVAGSGQGQYGEGFGDLMGVVMDDDPILGYGFTNNCNSGIRTGNNTKQYPCSGEIHDCGQLLTGCFWSTRSLLVVSNPSDYRTLLGDWAVNSVQMHTGTEITPSITVDVMTLDDDDADLTNGCPHYQQIQGGFSAHSMPGPTISALSFAYPDGRPAFSDPAGGTEFPITITPNGTNTINTSSAKLYVDVESDGSFVAYPLPYLGSNTYQATLPAAACNSEIRYYVSVKLTTGTTFNDPPSAPGDAHSVLSAVGMTTSFLDNAETDLGWTTARIAVNGQALGPLDNKGWWSRANPASSPPGPTSDFDGSGKCWLTGAGPNNNPEVDINMTMTSPTWNLTTGGDVLAYGRWVLMNAEDTGSDMLKVEVSNNNGATWTTMENVTGSSIGWEYVTHRLSDYVPLTAQMKVRFTIIDDLGNSVIEAALDAISLGSIQCSCPADFNHDGFVTGDDADDFYAAFDLGSPAADFNGDTFVTGDDFDAFSAAFAAGC